MKSYLLKLIFLCFVSAICNETLYAQTEPMDSTFFSELDEIVVEAPKVIHKSDMDVYHPSQSAVDNSKNGVQLLSNLMIPSLAVNEVLGSVKSNGEGVELRINGKKADINEIRNLLPSTVKRVEWIDNPSLRYDGANAVLNFIVVNPTLGGALMVGVQPALNVAFGNYNLSSKLNFGRSQIEVGGYLKLTQNMKLFRDYSETFTYPDGESVTRIETPRGGRADNTNAFANIDYNYIIPDTTVLVISVQSAFMPSNGETYYGLMSTDNSPEQILLTDKNGFVFSSPKLSAYWEQHFRHKQLLVVDFRAEYYKGRSFSDYFEKSSLSDLTLTDIHTNIRERNQMYAVEADYIKKWSASNLTAGASYIANRNRSQYENLNNSIFHQHQDKLYLFAQYLHRINKVTLSGGLGMQYTTFLFRETKQGSSSWNFRPQASVVYTLNSSNRFRLNFDSWQSAPTLDETNPTPQQIDGFQWRVGNPDLKTSNCYLLTLRYDFMLPRVYGQFGVRAFSSPDAITPVLNWVGDRLVTSYENSKGLKNISFFLSPQIVIVPDWVTFSAYVQWRRERMQGTGYTFFNSSWSGYGSVMVQHWGFTLTAFYQRAERNLWGQKISWGEDQNIVDLSYNWENWGFSVGCFMPFGNYDQGSESLNKWNKNIKHMRMDYCMPYIGINYNLSWGKQKDNASKLINVGGSIDSSKAGGR